MKKLFLILGMLLLSANTLADNIIFLHPVFYQQLSDRENNFFYVLKPNSLYYENSKTGATISIECKLEENQEYFIKMHCNNCQDSKCLSIVKNIHTFSLSKDKTAGNGYIISHKIYNNQNAVLLEETLTNDGLMTIPPYQ